MPVSSESLRFAVGAGEVSALLTRPPSPRFLFVVAHGAGAGMRHPFLTSIAQALAEREAATLRYQFPYMEAQARRPDPPAVASATVRAAVECAAAAMPGVPLIAGGKSFGGRMTSTAQAQAPLPGVRGLAFLGFPLHPPGRQGTARAEHLERVGVPMLFLQGTRDAFADLALLRRVVGRLGARATLHLVEGGDHSFRVPKRTGRTDAQVLAELAQTLEVWAGRLV
jgi:uncharacterized protein